MHVCGFLQLSVSIIVLLICIFVWTLHLAFWQGFQGSNLDLQCACKASILIVLSLPSSITQIKQENTERQDGGSPLRDRTVVHIFTLCSPDLLFHSILSMAELLNKHYIYLHHPLLTCLNILLFPADSILILVSGDRQPFIMRHHYTM